MLAPASVASLNAAAKFSARLGWELELDSFKPPEMLGFFYDTSCHSIESSNPNSHLFGCSVQKQSGRLTHPVLHYLLAPSSAASLNAAAKYSARLGWELELDSFKPPEILGFFIPSDFGNEDLA